MKTPIKDILRLVQKEGDFDESMSGVQEVMELAEDDLSESMKMLSVSIENPNDGEEFKHEFGPDRIYGFDRVFLYTPDDTLKAIIEKIVASPDKRLICLRKNTREVASVISITDIFTYVTR